MAVTRKEQIASGKKVTPLTREELRLAGKTFAPLTEEERFHKVAYAGESGGTQLKYIISEQTVNVGNDGGLIQFDETKFTSAVTYILKIVDVDDDDYTIYYTMKWDAEDGVPSIIPAGDNEFSINLYAGDWFLHGPNGEYIISAIEGF